MNSEATLAYSGKTVKKEMDGRVDGWLDGQTDGRTDGWVDGIGDERKGRLEI